MHGNRKALYGIEPFLGLGAGNRDRTDSIPVWKTGAPPFMRYLQMPGFYDLARTYGFELFKDSLLMSTAAAYFTMKAEQIIVAGVGLEPTFVKFMRLGW